MASESGWWQIKYTVEPDETDLAHIAQLIKEGYTDGEIVANEVNLKCKVCGKERINAEGNICPSCTDSYIWDP